MAPHRCCRLAVDRTPYLRGGRSSGCWSQGPSCVSTPPPSVRRAGHDTGPMGARDNVVQPSAIESLSAITLARAVVLVEGISDQLALQALAERRGRNLDAERISVVSIGGSKNIGR